MNALQKIGTCLLLMMSFLPLKAQAEEETFDRAVIEYLKGFRACSDANVLRLRNIAEANNKFAYYQQQLDLAVSIDESILTSTERDMDKNLAYCQRVEDNLKRAEATPILQHAFTYCEAARNALDAGQITESRRQFEEYRRYQEDAYAITASLDEVFVLASQVRSCRRFEEKLIDTESQLAAQKQTLGQIISLYQESKLECESTMAFVKRPGFGVPELNIANKMLKAALGKKNGAEAMTGGFEYARRHPQAEETIQLADLQETLKVCEGEVAEGIRAIARVQREYQRLISRDNRRLQQSLESCDKAEAAIGVRNLDQAKQIYQQSADLKKQATGNNTVNLVKSYPQWQESRGYNQLLEKTSLCHERAALKIKNLRASLAADQTANPLESGTNERPAGSPKEAAIVASPDDPPVDRHGDGLLPAQQDYAESDNWEDESFLDEDAALEEDEDRGAGRSWTDLIR